MTDLQTTTDSRWPHRLALVLCCATFPLVWVGGLVTTYQAGMAFEDWPTSDGHFLFFYPWLDWLRGPWDLFIEHGHRMLGAVIGLLTIAVCASMWLTRQPRWLKVMSLIALAAVIFQGLLGGIRVLLDRQTVAQIHGCFGPAFFAFTAVMAAVTSRQWHRGPADLAGNAAGNTLPPADVGLSNSLIAMAFATPLLAYLQLVLGSQLRHFNPASSAAVFRTYVVFHIVVGIALSVHIVFTAIIFRCKAPRAKSIVIPAFVLIGLVLCQLYLGVATWIVNHGAPSFLVDWGWVDPTPVVAHGWRQAQITTAHVAVGSLILAVATVQAAFAGRLLKFQSLALPHAAGWKGAATS